MFVALWGPIWSRGFTYGAVQSAFDFSFPRLGRTKICSPQIQVQGRGPYCAETEDANDKTTGGFRRFGVLLLEANPILGPLGNVGELVSTQFSVGNPSFHDGSCFFLLF